MAHIAGHFRRRIDFHLQKLVTVRFFLHGTCRTALQRHGVRTLLKLVKIVRRDIHLTGTGLLSAAYHGRTRNRICTRNVRSLPSHFIQSLRLGQSTSITCPTVIRVPQVAGMQTQPNLYFLVTIKLITICIQRINLDVIIFTTACDESAEK